MSFLSRSTRSLLLPPPLFPSVFCVIVHNMRGEQRARACHPGGGRDLGSPFSGCSRVAYLNPGTSPEGNTTRYHFFIIYPSLSPIFCQKKLGFSLFQEFWEGEVGHTSLVVQHRVRRKKKKTPFSSGFYNRCCRRRQLACMYWNGPDVSINILLSL